MKILVIRRDNIGDLICTTPLFKAIKNHYPQAYLAALVNSYNVPVLERNPYLDDFFAYTKGKHAINRSVLAAHWERIGILWKLRQKKFDYIILPNNGFAARSLQLARWLSPKHIIGFVTKEKFSPAIDLAIQHKTERLLHETEDIFRLLTPLGISGEIPGLTLLPDTKLANTIQQQVSANLQSSTGPLIALHISARKEKQRWPISSFIELAHRLHQQHSARFLIFWSPGDENNPFHPGDDRKAAELIGALKDLPATAVRTEQLAELIAGLSLCDTAILSDGGAMHIAAGLGKPIVCFFGNSSAERWHPWQVRYELLQKPSRDVSDITVEEAVLAFEKLNLQSH